MLRADPGRASRVNEVLDRWTTKGAGNTAQLQEWRHVLEAENWNAMLEESEASNNLRFARTQEDVSLEGDERFSRLTSKVCSWSDAAVALAPAIGDEFKD